MSRGIAIVGATGGIGRALAATFARDGDRLVLASRDAVTLRSTALDLAVRFGVEATALALDATDVEDHRRWFEAAVDRLGSLDGLVLAHGYMEEDDPEGMRAVNVTGAVSLLELGAAHLAARRTGFLCAVSSVAGDRLRDSNRRYGATKKELNEHMERIRNRLRPTTVHVLTVKPGFVDTGMTWGLLDPASPLVASPDRVARDVRRALDRRRDVVYTPWFWRPIMATLRALPGPVFRRLPL